jgi:hypothetical protein
MAYKAPAKEPAEPYTLREFGEAMEELIRRWRAIPPIVDDDFPEKDWDFRQQLDRVYAKRHWTV